VNYIIHNISKGKAPPRGRGNPLRISQSYCHLEGGIACPEFSGTERSATAELESYRFLSAFGMTKMTGGQLLLNMRDGPRGRAPAIRFAMVYGLVTLNKKSSVPLCEISVDSVVKKFSPQRKQGRHREHRAIYELNPTKTFRDYCTEDVRLQEEKVGKLRAAKLVEIPAEASGD